MTKIFLYLITWKILIEYHTVLIKKIEVNTKNKIT
jgi:hypothetical protein